jgi:hypothetical protein
VGEGLGGDEYVVCESSVCGGEGERTYVAVRLIHRRTLFATSPCCSHEPFDERLVP